MKRLGPPSRGADTTRNKPLINPTEPGGLREDEVKDFLKDKLAKFKILEWVEFVEDFPPTLQVSFEKRLRPMEKIK